jgi:hypothetical protein
VSFYFEIFTHAQRNGVPPVLFTVSRLWLFYGVILGIYLLSWLLQDAFLLNSDVSWLMLATKRLLLGGTYTKDFFEINPPMILYLYIPAVWIGNVFSLQADVALRVYVYLLATGSLICCWQVLYCHSREGGNPLMVRDNLTIGSRLRGNDKLSLNNTLNLNSTLNPTNPFKLNDNFNLTTKLYSMTVIVITAIIFLFLPLSEFGQREHLMLILIMPYLFLMADRSHHSTPFCILIGLMAGCGFVIKPYFLAPLILIELHHMRQTRNWLAWLRPEIAGIFFIFALSASIIFIVNRDYLTLVVPLITHLYYQKYALPLHAVLFNEQAVFAYYTLVFYWLSYQSNPHKKLSTILAITISGFLLAFFIQQTSWYYHTLPFFSLSILLCALLFIAWVNNPIIPKKNHIYTIRH